MSNVAEFIQARLQIESLVQEIVLSADREAIPKSRQRLEEAAQLLERLKAMADNYVQENSVGRLAGELSCLGEKVEKLARKKLASKKKLIA